MYKLFYLLFKRKLLIVLLVFTCISRSIAVLFLNKGYAGLIDRILTDTYGLMFNSIIILFCTGVIQVAIILFQNYISSMLSEKIGYTIRRKAIDGILNAEYKTIENLSTGESISKLNTDLSGVITWVRNEFSALISDSILFTIIIIAMLHTNWKLTVISFFIVPFFSIGSYLLSKPITASEKEKNKAISDVNVIAKSIIDAFPILKLFQMKQSLLNKANEKISISIFTEIKANSIRAKLMSINGFIAYTPTAIMLGLGGYMAIKGSISAGVLLAFINMSNFITGPLLNLPARIDAIRTSSSNISRVFDMLDKLIYKEKGGENMYCDIGQEIAVEFRNVSFGYTENKNIIDNISFKVQSGSKVAIVGESGCGKSTVLKLIAGLYPINSGQILFSGSDLENMDLICIRKYISFIPQESQLFPVSIYENISCGHPLAVENVMAACKAAQLESLINNLSAGIYTNIGEHGNKLSGGERQRICIARAIAKNAPLVLLDEATSALDGQTESAILEFFDTLKATKTIIFVTHKIKNAINADLVICIKNGQICESGTHENLIKADGYYARLYKFQNMLEVLSNEQDKSTVICNH